MLTLHRLCGTDLVLSFLLTSSRIDPSLGEIMEKGCPDGRGLVRISPLADTGTARNLEGMFEARPRGTNGHCRMWRALQYRAIGYITDKTIDPILDQFRVTGSRERWDR